MKKILTEIKENSKIHYIIIAIVALLASIPILTFQVMCGDDGVHHMLRVMGMKAIFNIKEFPPIINPDYCTNWGYGINLFYAPITTYVPYLLKFITGHYYSALKLYAFITTIVSGFAMYSFAKEVSKKNEVALLAAIIYMLFPYRLETIYNRFAIGEFSTYMFLPILFQGIYNLIKEDGRKHYFISIGAIGLILTHEITTFYTIPFCILYLLFNYKSLKNKEIIKKILVNTAVILSITAFFTIPVIEHKIYGDYAIFEPQYMRTNNDYVQDNTIELWQLFADKQTGNTVSFKIGLPITILILASIIAYKKIDSKTKDTYILFAFFATIALIMSSTLFYWKILPDSLCIIQYPWRMLVFFGFFISFVCGMNAYTILEKMNIDNLKKSLIFYLVILLIIALSMPMVTRYKTSENDKNVDIDYENKITNNPKISHMMICREYLPIKAIKLQRTYLFTRNDSAIVLKGNANITNENKKNNLTILFDINYGEKDTIIELPYIYYLGYKAQIIENGIKTDLETFESDNGFVAIKLPKDTSEANVIVTYNGTTIEKMGYAISGIALIICIGYSIIKKKKYKN